MRKFTNTDALLILMVLIWAANYSVIKATLATFRPLAFNILRFAIASFLILSLLWYRERNWRLPKKDLWKILILGFIGNTLYQIFFIEGIHLTRAGDATLILALSPMTILLLGALFGLERLRPGNVLSFGLAFLGVVLAIYSTASKPTQSAPNPSLGNALILVCMICWAIYSLFSASLMQHMSSLRFTALTMSLGTVLLFPFSLPQLMDQNWQAISPAAWGGLLYSACLALTFCYLVWYHGVSTLGNNQTTIYSNLTAPFGILIAWLFLGEDLGWRHFLGILMVLTGIFLNRRFSAHAREVTTDTLAEL
jgi:drug/metabolite transporter (DMT)-like permease